MIDNHKIEEKEEWLQEVRKVSRQKKQKTRLSDKEILYGLNDIHRIYLTKYSLKNKFKTVLLKLCLKQKYL